MCLYRMHNDIKLLQNNNIKVEVNTTHRNFISGPCIYSVYRSYIKDIHRTRAAQQRNFVAVRRSAEISGVSLRPPFFAKIGDATRYKFAGL